MIGRAKQLVERATEFLEAAKDSFAQERYSVAFEEARTAAELASKALLMAAGSSYAKEHNVAGPLHQRRLIPKEMSAAELSSLLGDYSRGAYGFDQPIGRLDAKQAVRLAHAMLSACVKI